MGQAPRQRELDLIHGMLDCFKHSDPVITLPSLSLSMHVMP
jgi:hypothetical protein